MTRMRAWWAILVSLAGWLVLPGVADAQIVKCRDAQGRLTYTSEKCPAGTQPEALPQDISPALPDPSRPRPETPTASAAAPASAELRAREPFFRECLSSATVTARCEQFEAQRLKCSYSEHWDLAECKVLAELYLKLEHEGQAKRLATLNERCRSSARTDRAACEAVDCGFTPYREADTAKIISCARRKQLQVGETWVQFEQHAAGRDHSLGGFVCQQVWRLRSGAGEWGHHRNRFSIEREFVEGKPTQKLIASGLPLLRFDSIEEAAKASCAEANVILARRANLPENRIAGVTPPKIPVGYIPPAPPFTAEEFVARKAELDGLARACSKPDATGCDDYRRRRKRCQSLRNRPQLDCLAFIEVLPKVRADIRAEFQKTYADLCAKSGSRGFCQAVYCNQQLRYEKSDELVRQCPKRNNWRSTDDWWQVNEFLNGSTWTASFMCVKSWPIKGSVGEPMDIRGSLLVQSPTENSKPVGPYTTSSIKDLEGQSFASVETLADAGCRVLNERFAAKLAKDEEENDDAP
jgi:hypothetical protein